MLISLRVGKVDAGIAILLTEDRRLIEFPSILLPNGIFSGSIVDIQVSRNTAAELTSANTFAHLQEEIFSQFGIHSPTKPQLRIRNATQTSVVLEWDPINLATATLRSLTLYRNGARSGSIPNPTSFTATKISGLAMDTEYTFHLVLKTSAGTYSSDKITVKTQKLTDLSGITLCPGVMPPEAKEQLETTLLRIGAKPLQDYVRIDTTHFVCTEERGQAWERAVEMNIPVVRPEWVEACESEWRIVGVRAYYLTADPRLMRPILREREPKPGTAGPGQQQQQQQQKQQKQKQRHHHHHQQEQQQQHQPPPPLPWQQQQQEQPHPKNSLDTVAAQAANSAGSTPAQTPDLRQNSPFPERKELPLQLSKEGVPESQDEVVAVATQADSHAEERAAESKDEGDEESLDEDEKQKEKENTSQT